LSLSQLEEIVNLVFTAFPPKDGNTQLQSWLERYRRDRGSAFNKVILCREEGVLAGHAEIFGRRITAQGREINNLALAKVCVRKESRGKQYGVKLVRSAFEYIHNGRFDCAVFQTKVPRFYDKIGCRAVDVPVINSQNMDAPEANPFWDPHILIYPGNFDLGSRPLDLRGPGY
jgi:predicted N-acetyltransferase YhbS